MITPLLSSLSVGDRRKAGADIRGIFVPVPGHPQAAAFRLNGSSLPLLKLSGGE